MSDATQTIADREYAKYAAAAICREFDERGEIPFSISVLMELIAPHVADRSREAAAAVESELTLSRQKVEELERQLKEQGRDYASDRVVSIRDAERMLRDHSRQQEERIKELENAIKTWESMPSVSNCQIERDEGNGGCGACALCCKELKEQRDEAVAQVAALNEAIKELLEAKAEFDLDPCDHPCEHEDCGHSRIALEKANNVLTTSAPLVAAHDAAVLEGFANECERQHMQWRAIELARTRAAELRKQAGGQ